MTISIKALAARISARASAMDGVGEGWAPAAFNEAIKNCGNGAGGFQPGNSCARGGGGGVDAAGDQSPSAVVASLGRTTEGNDSTTQAWNSSLAKYDEKAVGELQRAVPGAKVEKIEGDYVHEPRLTAFVPDDHPTLASPGKIVSALREAGYKGKAAWNKPDSVTLQSADRKIQITVDKFVSTGHSPGFRVRMYPQYDIDEFPVPSGKKSWAETAFDAALSGTKGKD